MMVILLALFLIQHHEIMFHYPRWSPDGKWLVMTANVDGDDEEVWIVSSDGKERRKLTDNAVADTNADWHPDGTRIVFERHGADGVKRLMMNIDGTQVRDADVQRSHAVAGLVVEERRTADRQAIVVIEKDGKVRRISEVGWAEQPSVSPDGRFIVFEQRESPHEILSSDIAIWDVRRGSLRILARGTDPSWTPDSRSVVFKTPRPPNNSLFIAIADVESGKVRLLAPGVHPHLSPDGRWIAFMADRQDRADVHVIGTDATRERCLTCSWK
jgi:Tol biopolymer transport system component